MDVAAANHRRNHERRAVSDTPQLETSGPASVALDGLLDRSRTILVLGKGGVGKTTVAKALVDALAARGLGARRLELGLGAGASTGPGVTFIDPDQAFERAAEPIFGSRALVRAAFGHSAVKELLTVVPGLREYALLVVALGLADASGRRRANERNDDRVVVDMPATGHGLAWLSAARRLAAVAGRGRAHQQAIGLDQALRSRADTGLVLVTQCEPLILSETDELRSSLRATLERDPDLLVVNRVPRPLASTVELEALSELSDATQDLHTFTALERLRQWCAGRERARELCDSLGPACAKIWLEDTRSDPGPRAWPSSHPEQSPTKEAA